MLVLVGVVMMLARVNMIMTAVTVMVVVGVMIYC